MRREPATSGGGPMRAGFSSRRRADEFDALLDGSLAHPPTAELAELAELVGRVQAVAAAAPRPEFAASLRERLMAAAPEALAAAATDQASARLTVRHRTPSTGPSRKRRERRIAVAIAAFSLVGATTASAVASQGSVPGDTLYPVKRLIENARTSLAMGQHAKADVLLSQARTRLTEVRELAGREDAHPADIEQGLRDFGSAADHASTIILADYADHGDRRPVDQLRTFTEQGVTTLGELAGVLPSSVDAVLADVTNTLIAIDQSAAEACPACDAAGVTELPGSLVALLSATTGSASSATPVTAPHATPKPHRPKAGHTPGASPAPAVPSTLLDQLAGPLANAGGGQASTTPGPSGAPTSPGGAASAVGGALGGAVSGVGGAVGGAGSQVPGPVGGVLGGVGGAVGDLGGTVDGTTGQLGDTVDGVVGGLLGTPAPTPSP